MKIIKHQKFWMVVLLAAGIGAWLICVRGDRSPVARRPASLPAAGKPIGVPADDAYVGQSREQILASLGSPSGRSSGSHGLVTQEWARSHDPCETPTYQIWHGMLYIAVYKTNGRWICCSSNWLPPDGAF